MAQHFRGVATDDLTITSDQARSAARKINAYMATRWTNEASQYRSARVTTLGAFHVDYYGELATLWKVVTWNQIGLSSLLFLEKTTGEILLHSGTSYFLEQDLYPEMRQADPVEATIQKGGAR